MPGIDASIPLGVKTPDTMQQLSGLLNVANSAQTLQQNKQATQQGGIDLQERQGMQQFLSDPSNYTDETGAMDMNKFQGGIAKYAPTTGFKYMQAAAAAQKAHTDAMQAVNNLSTDNRQHIGAVLASLPADAPQDLVAKTIDSLRTQYKGIGPAADVFMSGYKSAAQQGPDAAHNFVLQQARGVLPQPTQQDMASGSLSAVPTATGTAFIQTKTGAATPQGGQVGQTFAPPNQVVTTPTGRVGTLNAATGAYNEPTPATPATPPINLPQGETADTLKLVQGIRMNASQAARSVPDQQFNSNQIVKLADETDTGKGAQLFAGLKGGYASVPWTSDSASNFNQLGHYMALQTSQLSQTSGLGGTDAAHSIAAEQAGNREWTRDAIKSTARVNRALSTGTDLFNRGVDNAVKSTGNPFAARDFQNEWSKTASVDALRVYDAYKNRGDDPDGWKQVVKELGGASSDKFKSTMQKVDAMKALIRGEK